MEETHGLLSNAPAVKQPETPLHTARKNAGVIALLVSSAALVGALMFYTTSAATAAALAANESQGPSIDITHFNEYSKDGKHPGKGYLHITHGMVVEPFREHTFTADLASNADPVLATTWTVTQQTNFVDAPQFETHSGPVAKVLFQHGGKYTVKCEITTSAGQQFAKEMALDSLYVRRDLRSLSSTDMDTLFNAMYDMYTMTDADGRGKYGPDFKSMVHFTNVHLNYAGNRQGDRMHDGMGFITQHLALTSEFESALQAINGALTVPYWDYTYDKYLVDSKNISNIFKSPMWSDDIFGSPATSNEHIITTGRWAYLTVPQNRSAETTNAYGYLRAPWNVNRSPYITRSQKTCGVKAWSSWPGCITHYDVTFSGYYDSWYNYVWAASYIPHGPVHTLIGGYLNCEAPLDKLATQIQVSNASMAEIKSGVITYLKGLWREKLIEAPTCSMDVPQDECLMQCTADPYKSDEYREAAIEYMALSLGKSWIAELSIPNQQLFLKTVMCSIPYVSGDQLEAGSPSDPSFWSIHPTVDRLLQYRHLVNEFANEDWGNPEGETEYCRTGNECLGHHANDLTPFETKLVAADGMFYKKMLTNEELYAHSHPTNYALTYVYDKFEWDHCDAQGYTFVTVG